MKAHYLGHVVFYVKDLQRALAFYRDLLGFQEVGRVFNGAAAALTSGRTHHELLLIQVGDAPGPPPGRRRGLYHIGIKVGDSLEELRAAKIASSTSGLLDLGDEGLHRLRPRQHLFSIQYEMGHSTDAKLMPSGLFLSHGIDPFFALEMSANPIPVQSCFDRDGHQRVVCTYVEALVEVAVK